MHRLPEVDAVAERVHEAWRQEKILLHGVKSRPSAISGQEQLVPWSELHKLDKDSNRMMIQTVYKAIAIAPRPTAGLSFGDAIGFLKSGYRVARAGWNGKGMWLSYSPGFALLPAAKFWSPHNRAFAEANGGAAGVLPCITMKTATGEILMGWLASQTDMLAEDWMVLPESQAPGSIIPCDKHGNPL